jgi:hypothetical protein
MLWYDYVKPIETGPTTLLRGSLELVYRVVVYTV